MSRAPAFTVREGSSSVLAYKYGQPVYGADKKSDRAARYCLAWYRFAGDELQRETKTGERAARDRAKEIATDLANDRSMVVELTSADRESYLRAKALLAPTGVPLHEAVECFVNGRAANRTILSAREVLDRLLLTLPTAKTLGMLRYIRGIRNDLASFVTAHPRLEATRAHDIRTYLAGLKVGPRRRDNILTEIITLYRFARTKDGGEVFPSNELTEAEQVKRLNEPTDVTTYSPEELSLIFRFASAKWLPLFAIGAFAGLRPSEVVRLDWSMFKWKEKPEPRIAVPGRIARKTGKPRRAEFPAILQQWLGDWRDAVGSIYPCATLREQRQTEEAIMYEIAAITSKIRAATNSTTWSWHNDGLRHSYGSYRWAQIKDFALIAAWMGNSPQVVKDRYYDSKSEEEAAAWFSISKEHASNVIQMPMLLG
jgi:integrase